MLRYIVISPAKDEANYLEHTLCSMINQTVKPVRWIIVDDGSSDRTPEILNAYSKEQDFIEILKNPRGAARQPGSAVIHAFNRGYEAAKNLDYDLIVKLDCDLSFDADYFEKLIIRFEADPKLGIASGVYSEFSSRGQWSEIAMPSYHAAGASKVIQRVCFEQIRGFIPARGWDTIDEIRAIALGWRTCHFPEMKMKHWKPEGSGIGKWRTSLMHGEIYYLTGGGAFFFLLKVLHRVKSPPFALGAMAMLWGYLAAALRGTKRLVTPTEALCYRALLNARITGKISRTVRSKTLLA